MEFILARWITFAATLLTVGCCALGVAIIPRSRADDETRHALLADLARIGVLACLVLIPASLLRLTDQLLALRSSGDPLFAGVRPLLLSTTWGSGFLCQMLALSVALPGLLVARRLTAAPWAWWGATAGAIGLSVTLSLQGHAIGNERYTLIAVLADATHVLAAGLWIGSIGVIGALGATIRNADGVVAPDRAARADARLRLLVPLVPPVALTGAALLLISGVISSLLQLRDVQDLWTAAWGRYVALKVILVLVVVTLGARNWRQLGPRVHDARGVRALRRTLLLEVALAALVLLITALLVVTPLPGE